MHTPNATCTRLPHIICCSSFCDHGCGKASCLDQISAVSCVPFSEAQTVLYIHLQETGTLTTEYRDFWHWAVLGLHERILQESSFLL